MMERTTSMGYYTLLRGNPQVRRLWFAQVVSELGDWFNLVALMQLITQYSSKAEMTGLLLIIQTVPFVLFSPLAGYLADRLDRKKLMIVADLSRAVIVLGFLFIQSAREFWFLYPLAALQFVVTSFFEPARSALISNLALPEERMTTNALSGATWSVMFTGGTALGGLIVTFFPLWVAFLLDSTSFLVSAVFLSQIQSISQIDNQWQEEKGLNHHPGQMDMQRMGWFHGIFSLFWKKPQLLSIALLKTGLALTGGVVWMLASVYGQQIFPWGQGGSLSLGLLYGMMGIGAIFGSVWVQKSLWVHQKPLQIIFWLYLLRVPMFFALGACRHLFGVAFVCLFHMMSGSILWVISTTLLQEYCPDELRGRIFAFENAVQTAAFILAIHISGFTYDHGISASQIAFFASILAFMVAAVWGIYLRMNHKKLSEHMHDR